jgi:hypothetical protein
MSIWKFGAIAMYREVMEKWLDPQADAAQLQYDADGKRVAIGLCKKTEPYAYALQRTKAGGQVNAKSFLTHHGQKR